MRQTPRPNEQESRTILQGVKFGDTKSFDYYTALECKHDIDVIRDFTNEFATGFTSITEADNYVESVQKELESLGAEVPEDLNLALLKDWEVDDLYERNGGEFRTYRGDYYTPDETETLDEDLYERCQYQMMLENFVSDAHACLYDYTYDTDRANGSNMTDFWDKPKQFLDAVSVLDMEKTFCDNAVTDKTLRTVTEQQRPRLRPTDKQATRGLEQNGSERAG